MATTVAEQISNAVSTPLYTAVMNVLKVPTDAVPPFPELTELEAHQLLTLTQQLIDRQQLLETLKKTHTERHFGPITERPCTVTDGLYGLRMQRPGQDHCNQCLLARCLAREAIWDSSSPDVTGSIVFRD